MCSTKKTLYGTKNTQYEGYFQIKTGMIGPATHFTGKTKLMEYGN